MMRNLFIVIAFLFTCSLAQAQDNPFGVSKDKICLGAAVSMVWNISPLMNHGRPKSEVLSIVQEVFKPDAHASLEKTYDLLSTGKTKEEVTNILQKDFMKLDDKIVYGGLISPQDDEEFDESEE